jgi:adenosylcobinamide kinase / adenosylcobinamide-phosphate guanylyltransferase
MRKLIVGGARSGKTRVALETATRLSQELQCGVVYVATAEPLDVDMSARIARHRAERPANWQTVEAPSNLGVALSAIASPAIIIVDCLTLWLSNAVLRDFDDDQPRAELISWQRENDEFFEFLREYTGVILLVSNEVGAGIVPTSALARRFQDEQGWLNQRAAAVCDHASLVVAGLELKLK